MRSGGQETGESLEWPSPFSAPPAYLECQLHEDDAPRQCPLQVVGGHWRASALQKGKRWVHGQSLWVHQPWSREEVPWVSDYNGIRLGSTTSVITQGK